jgi:succinoglycan biosynthesis transport protein ExoP
MAPVRTVAPAGLAGGRTDAAAPFGMAELFAVSRKRSALIRNVALGLIAATLLVLYLLPSSYTGTAIVLLDPRKNNVTGLSSVLSEEPTDPASVQNQIQILTSRDLAGEVIQRLDLEDDPEFNTSLSRFPLDPRHWFGELSAEGQYSTIIDDFLKHLSVDSIGLSSAISVEFASHDPAKSARITNAIVDAYIQSQIEVNSEAGHRTTAWLAQRIRELARQVEIAEANVQRYKAENAINDTGDGHGSVVEQQLAAINTQLVQARADLAAKQANFDRINALLKSGDVADVSAVVSSPLIVQLRTQQSDAIRDEAELASRYGPKHPKRVAAESQLHDLQGKIDLEANRIAGSVANDLAVQRAQVKSLEDSLAQAESLDNDQNLASVQLKALESDAASTRTMYESFVTRFRETQGQDVVPISDARIISHASVPTLPSSPKRLLIFAASIPAGILLGLLCALILERAQPAGAPARAIRRAPVPILAEIPNGASPRAADLVSDMPSSPFAQGMAVLARRVAEGPRILAVTSLDPRDGQSNIAVALSRALARSGRRVVLIDAHPPTTAWTMSMPPAGVDAAEVLRGAVPLARAFTRDPRSNVLLISSASGGAWLSPRMGPFIDHLRRSADVIIIDAPPLWTPELARVAAYAQGFLVVVGKSTPHLPRLAETLSQPRPTGIVLTA